jgi:SAM-dependent methyltransferase
MTTTIDFEAIKQRQQKMWSSGGYARIGTTLQLIGEQLAESVDIRGGSYVLDVAAGNGNASLAAARRDANVVATDYVPELLELAQARADANGIALKTEVADAEDLPFDDDTFDVTLSTVGVMFAPDQDQAASELTRVTKSGGKIGLASWTPDGFVGHMLRTVGAHVPPPAGVRSPVEWGKAERVGELLGDRITDIQLTERTFVFRYRSVDAFVEEFTTYYGPIVTALANLDDAGRTSLTEALRALVTEWNTATDGTARVPATYLEVVATVA